MVDIERLRSAFLEKYSREPRLFRAPGRVNLIGEHTDYNDGFVLPMAINKSTMVAADARSDRQVRITSLNAREDLDFDLDRPGQKRRGIWLDYVEGVAHALENEGTLLRGADLIIDSDVPEGAGLSSSAALEVAIGFALCSVSNIEINPVALALAGQHAEHEWVGANVGIMDQFIAALGRRGTALLIDCRSFETRHIPLDMSRAKIAICDTRVKHELSSSEYNTRRLECEKGVELLQKSYPGIKALRDVSEAEFRSVETEIPEPVRSRCRHVVSENARTLAAAESLKAGDLQKMGKLMLNSHRSLRDNYQVSCAELDFLVDTAEAIDGVLGSRMTGGGFGGCTVNMVVPEKLDKFSSVIATEYFDKYKIETNIYIVEAENGASEIAP